MFVIRKQDDLINRACQKERWITLCSEDITMARVENYQMSCDLRMELYIEGRHSYIQIPFNKREDRKV